MQRAGDRPIRVRFIHTRYGHWGARSGYPCFTRHLDARRFHIETHATPDDHDEIVPWLRPLQPWLRGWLQRRPMKWYKVSDLNAELNAARGCLVGDVDIVHFLDGEHCGQFLPPLLTQLRSRVRTVVTYHQPPDLLRQILDPSILPFFDHVALMSPTQKPYFDGRVAADKISVLLHGVDTEFFHPAVGHRSPGPLRCITAGHWLRDWQVFRSVARQAPDVQFYAVTAHPIGAEDLPNVIWRSGLSDADLAALYRAADVLFLPLTDSTANNALLEGIATGLPVVATDLPAVRAYLGDAGAMLAPLGDADGHLILLRRFQHDLALRQRAGALARVRAEALSWPHVAEKYEAIYASLSPA